MNGLNLNQNIDADALLTHLMAEAAEGDREGIKASSSRIRSHSEKIQEKRQEQLDNINEQLKNAGGNGCITLLKSVFKVFDLLLKPLSKMTGGILKLELGNSLEMLQQAKTSGRLTGLQINEKELQNAIASIKKLLQDDMEQLKTYQSDQHEENQKIMEILDTVQDSFKTITQI